MEDDIEGTGKWILKKPWMLEYRSSNGFILATVCVAIFTVSR